MTKQLTETEKVEIYEYIRDFLSDELDVPKEEIQPQTKIIDDLHGDSMIYLELIEDFKKKYSVNVEIRVIGQYLQRHPVYTIEGVTKAVCDIIERGDAILANEPAGPGPQA
jgi:acyl carrier protein